MNVRLSSYTVAQLKELASRFDMSESTVIMLAIDRLARDTQAAQVGEDKGILLEGREKQQKKGEQNDGNDGKGDNSEATRTRRRNNPQA